MGLSTKPIFLATAGAFGSWNKKKKDEAAAVASSSTLLGKPPGSIDAPDPLDAGKARSAAGLAAMVAARQQRSKAKPARNPLLGAAAGATHLAKGLIGF